MLSRHLVNYNGIKYGAIAGMLATWSISTAIAASEVELGLPISTFYSIMGLSLGSNDFVSAAYIGFGLHLMTGSVLGAAIGLVSTRWMKIMINPYKAVLAGILAGVVVWMALFLPVTVLLVQPAMPRIAPLLPDGIQGASISQSIAGIVSSAAAFHVAWGAIFGYISSSLMRIKALRTEAGGVLQ